jgi:DNA-binding protein H-NS
MSNKKDDNLNSSFLSKIDFSELSIEEVESYAKAAKKVILDRQKKEREDALHSILVSTLKHQLSLEEVVLMLHENRAIFEKKYQNGQPQRLYQNPNNKHEIFGGTGRQPDWLREKLALGHNMEEFEMFKEFRTETEQLQMVEKIISRCSGKKQVDKSTLPITALGEVSTKNAQVLFAMASADSKIVAVKQKNDKRKKPKNEQLAEQ